MKSLKVLRLKKEKEGFVFSYKELEPERGMNLGITIINSNQIRKVSEEDIDNKENREELKRELTAYNMAQISKHEQDLINKKNDIMENINKIQAV